MQNEQDSIQPVTTDSDESSSVLQYDNQQAESKTYNNFDGYGFHDRLVEESINDKKNDRSKRNQYAACLFGLVCVYLILMFILLFFAGFQTGGFKLESSVLITLLGTTTANVIGLFTIVTSYFFYRRKR